jgi:hypothetical protein
LAKLRTHGDGRIDKKIRRSPERPPPSSPGRRDGGKARATKRSAPSRAIGYRSGSGSRDIGRGIRYGDLVDDNAVGYVERDDKIAADPRAGEQRSSRAMRGTPTGGLRLRVVAGSLANGAPIGFLVSARG